MLRNGICLILSILAFCFLFTTELQAEDTANDFYRLRVGDRLQVSIYAVPGSKRSVVVSHNGEISYLNARNIEAQGKSIAELREELQKILGHYYREPILAINPQRFNNEYFTVLGEVRLPGIKRYAGNPTVSTALCQAGGFTTRIFRNQTIDQADLERSFLSRRGEYIPIDFNALLNGADTRYDIPLLPGDYLYFPPKTIPRVYVLGEVFNPTAVSFFDTVSLSEAIAEAGGITRFASSRVAVIRGSLFCPERYLIDFNRIIKGCALDFPLMAGDIVYVPSMQYTTLKEMVRAGIAAFVSGIFSIAGTNAFIAIQPHAAVTGVLTPVTFINPGVGLTSVNVTAAAVP